MNDNLILSLDSDQADLPRVGGKGMNLARLTRADLPVPGGFLITTAAYRAFVQTNNLTSFIQKTVAAVQPDDPAALNEASQTIRARFSAGKMPDDLATAVTTAYKNLPQSSSLKPHPSPPVAVRSSATAEDLPDMSFAGQQDTFLNVMGEAGLLKAVVDCWSSLWTARAIGYRTRNRIPHDDVALAVVVQAMVQSEASGVLFTANPLTGKRDEMVIDATLGLGEALVSGLVEPDQYIVSDDGTIVNKTLGAKATLIRGQTDGGVITESIAAAGRQAIPDTVIVALTALGKKVTQLFGVPQDIEWAWADGNLYLLQSRPITSLFPLPQEVEAAKQLQVLFSFGSVQGMLDPITPLGQDTLVSMLAGLGQLFKMPRSRHNQNLVYEAAERLWINFTAVIRHPVGRKIVNAAMPTIDPTAGQAVSALLDDPRMQPGKRWFKARTFARVGRFLLPTLARLLRALRHPDKMRREFQAATDDKLQAYAEQFAAIAALDAWLNAYEALLQTEFSDVIRRFLPVIAGGMASLNLTFKLTADIRDDGHDPLVLTRGMEHNVTTEMDLALWQTAQAIRADKAAFERVAAGDPENLAQSYLAEELPAAAQTAVSQFLTQYGMRGLAEIDFGRPRWRDNPAPIFRTLQSYLQITDPDQAPAAVFTRGAVAAETAVTGIAATLRQEKHGRIKAKLFTIAARRLRALAGLRESPKFFIIRLFGQMRQALQAIAEDLAAQGILARPDDLFFLRLDELHAIANREEKDWQAIIRERQAVYGREKQRRQIPNLLLSDGTAIFEGTPSAGTGDLAGTPVSPGVVEGIVRIVFNPHETQLDPGEILVCPGTDPAWTPLFLAAGGLITEVGGLMTHGSVVAREYGIPAVVGVHQATTRLQTGQRIRLDGSSGQIEIID